MRGLALIGKVFLRIVRLKGGVPNPGYHEDYLKLWKNVQGNPELVKVNAESFPKVYSALLEECAFRNVPMPACYVDTTGECSLGYAIRDIYSIFVEPAIEERFTQEEIRLLIAHELKRLYQCNYETAEDSCLAEFDCDRASIESGDYKTLLSYSKKVGLMQIEKSVPKRLQGLASFLYKAFSKTINENFPISIDRNKTTFIPLNIVKDYDHPSPAARMKHMREWDKYLREKPRRVEPPVVDFE